MSLFAFGLGATGTGGGGEGTVFVTPDADIEFNPNLIEIQFLPGKGDEVEFLVEFQDEE